LHKESVTSLTEGGSMTPVSEEPDTSTAVPPKSTAEELGERLMETADTMAHDMGIPTAALIAIIVGKYVFTCSHNTLYSSRMLETNCEQSFNRRDFVI
jgi:hypothetical protein